MRDQNHSSSISLDPSPGEVLKAKCRNTPTGIYRKPSKQVCKQTPQEDNPRGGQTHRNGAA